jgi:hypothetical protein
MELKKKQLESETKGYKLYNSIFVEYIETDIQSIPARSYRKGEWGVTASE